MSQERQRRQVALEVARLAYSRDATEFTREKFKAARRLWGREPRRWELPTNREIREQVLAMAAGHRHQQQAETVHRLRLGVLQIMRALRAFHPRLLAELSERPSDGQLVARVDARADDPAAVLDALARHGIAADARRQTGPSTAGPVALLRIDLPPLAAAEVTIVPTAQADQAPDFSTGQARYGAADATFSGAADDVLLDSDEAVYLDADQVEQLIAEQMPEVSLEEIDVGDTDLPDRFLIYESLLAPLEQVRQDPRRHPEGDLLYHSLQVFQLVRDAVPYDEELLLAALLHDAGKAIDRKDHVAAVLEALDDSITPRTAWLIDHHMEARALRDRTLGARARGGGWRPPTTSTN